MAPTASGELAIFICYRRADTSGEAVALSDKLNRRRGFAVFKDVDNIRPGQDWLEAIEESIEACDVLLALIGTEWVGPRTEEGHSLDEYDHVRREIEAALGRKKAVIPILFETAAMPRSESLPESLRPLLRRQSLRIRNSTFNRDLDVLVAQLRTIAREKAALVAPAARASEQPSPAAPAAAAPPTRPKPLPPPPPPTARTAAAAAASRTEPVQPKPTAAPTPAPTTAPSSYPATSQTPSYGSSNTYVTPQAAAPYQQPWPGQPAYTAGQQYGGQPRSAMSPLRLGQAAGVGLAISGGLMALLALVALVAPSEIVDPFTSPDVVFLIGIIFGVFAATQFAGAYGIFKRLRWGAWAGGISSGIAGVVYLISFTPVGFLFAAGEFVVLACVVATWRSGYFPTSQSGGVPPAPTPWR